MTTTKTNCIGLTITVTVANASVIVAEVSNTGDIDDAEMPTSNDIFAGADGPRRIIVHV